MQLFITSAIGLLLVNLVAAGSTVTAAPSSSPTRGRQLKWLSTASGPPLTHGFSLSYQLGVYMNTSVASPDVTQLANGMVAPSTIPTLVSDFSGQLSLTLHDEILARFPPGMKSVQVNNVQPGYPINVDLLMYVTLDYVGNPSHTSPAVVMENTDSWMQDDLVTSSQNILALGFVNQYGLEKISVTASAENAANMQDCQAFVAKQGPFAWTSKSVYIAVIILPIILLLVLAVGGVRFWIARRNRHMARDRQLLDTVGGSVPAVGTAAAPASSTLDDYSTAHGAQQQNLNLAVGPCIYVANKDGLNSHAARDYIEMGAIGSTPVTQQTYAAYPSAVSGTLQSGIYPTYDSSSHVMLMPAAGYVSAPPHAYAGSSTAVQQQFHNNPVTSTAGGPIVRNQGVWSRMFVGPQVM